MAARSIIIFNQGPRHNGVGYLQRVLRWASPHMGCMCAERSRRGIVSASQRHRFGGLDG